MADSASPGSAFFSRSFDSVVAREDLTCCDQPRQLCALLHITALMTVGKDMSSFFAEVSALISSTNVAVKRLTYCYLRQYSHMHPEKTVLQVGSFVKDTLNESPLMRGAAIRAMTSLEVGIMSDFVKAPLRRLLHDSDAYVRRNAVMGVLKAICVSNALTNSELLDRVVELLLDDSPSVVATAIIALQELSQRGIISDAQQHFTKAKHHFVKLLDTATEWPAFYILEALGASFTGENVEDAEVFVLNNEEAIMRILPFTCFANSALVIAASKAICQFLRSCDRCLPQRDSWEVRERFSPTVVRALVSQLNGSRYETRYVVLRNIQLLLTTPFFSHFLPHLSSFRLLYDDPLYIKLEKVRCLTSFAVEPFAAATVMAEVFCHTRSSSFELMQESIRSIGLMGSRVEAQAEAAVQCLESLVASGVQKVVDESVVVLFNLLKYYPNKFPSAVQTICGAIESIHSCEAKKAAVLLIGQCPTMVDDHVKTLRPFMDGFQSAPEALQLATLSTSAILYATSSEKTRETMKSNVVMILQDAVRSLSLPLRDWALLYLRLLVCDAVTANRLLADAALRTPKRLSAETMDMSYLLDGMGSLASIEHKPLDAEVDSDESGADDDSGDADHVAVDTTEEMHSSIENDASPLMTVVVSPENNNGLCVKMAWVQLAPKLILTTEFSLHDCVDSISEATVIDLQINHNAFGLGVGQLFPVTKVTRDAPTEVSVVVKGNNEYSASAGLEIAINVPPLGVRRFLAPPIPAGYLLLPPVPTSKRDYASIRKTFTTPAWSHSSAPELLQCSANDLSVNTFRMMSLTLVNTVVDKGYTAHFLYAETNSHERLLIELTVNRNQLVLLHVFTRNVPVGFFFGEYLLRTILGLH